MNTVLPAFHPSVWIERLGPSKRLADLLEVRDVFGVAAIHRKTDHRTDQRPRSLLPLRNLDTPQGVAVLASSRTQPLQTLSKNAQMVLMRACTEKSVGGIEPPDIRELNSNAHQRDFVAGFHFSR
jgi:hypothetical protein